MLANDCHRPTTAGPPGTAPPPDIGSEATQDQRGERTPAEHVGELPFERSVLPLEILQPLSIVGLEAAELIQRPYGRATECPVDGDMTDLDAALGQQLLHVPVGQTEAQMSAHRPRDDLGRTLETRERRPQQHHLSRAAGRLHRAMLS
jgi:hypothetical protein